MVRRVSIFLQLLRSLPVGSAQSTVDLGYLSSSPGISGVASHLAKGRSSHFGCRNKAHGINAMPGQIPWRLTRLSIFNLDLGATSQILESEIEAHAP